MTFSKARDGTPICFFNGLPLHSSYNPIKEAKRFVFALNPPFPPSFVVVTEPAMSYTAQFFREKFPKAKIFAVRYCNDFSASDSLWDGVFRVEVSNKANVINKYGISDSDSVNSNASIKPLKTLLYNALGEEGLFSAFFCAWQPSSRAFPNENDEAWRGIQEAVSLSRDVLATRTRFASRWVLNAFSLCVRINNIAVLKKGNAPVVVAASGASLESSLPYLKKMRNGYFLIALSSALSPLRYAGLQCDLCLTTDGGFYAGKHLLPYIQGENAPLAIAAEGHCFASILERAQVIPLVYGDGPASEILRQCVRQAVMAAERNGTVSGTALRLALELTTGNVYFCGLDLSSGEGRQHCPPNVLETAAAGEDNRIRTMETRTAHSSFSSSSLEIYRKWFASLDADAARRVFRLSCSKDSSLAYRYNNTLGNIQDVCFNQFEQHLDEFASGCEKSANGNSKALCFPKLCPRPMISVKERCSIAKNFVKQKGNTDKWLNEIFPADCILIKHAADKDERERRKAVLKEKNSALLGKIYRILQSQG